MNKCIMLSLFLFSCILTLSEELYPKQKNFGNQEYQNESLLIRYNNWQDEKKFNELVGIYRNYPTQRERLEKQLNIQEEYEQANLNYYKAQQEVNLYNQINPRDIYYYNEYNDYYYKPIYKRRWYR